MHTLLLFLYLFLVAPPGLEPGHPASEAGALTNYAMEHFCKLGQVDRKYLLGDIASTWGHSLRQ